MKQLADNYRKNGYDYKLIRRNGDVAVYEQFSDGKSVAFEVFIVQKNKERVMAGSVVPAAEGVPSTETWGMYAYTCGILSQCANFEAILQERIDSRKNAFAISAQGHCSNEQD